MAGLALVERPTFSPVDAERWVSPAAQCYAAGMRMYETALGRLVPENEVQTVLEDSVLWVLFSYRMNPQNSANMPMKLGDLARAVSNGEAETLAAIDALREAVPPYVEEGPQYQASRTFRITGTGVRFVRNLPQGLASVL